MNSNRDLFLLLSFASSSLPLFRLFVCLSIRSSRVIRNGVYCATETFWLVPLCFFLIFSFAFECSPPPNHLVCSFVPLVSAALGNSFDFCGCSGWGGKEMVQELAKNSFFSFFLSSGAIPSYGEVVSDLSKWLTDWVNPLNFNVWTHIIVLFNHKKIILMKPVLGRNWMTTPRCCMGGFCTWNDSI